MLGFRLTGAKPDCFSQVKSEKWHHICQGSMQFPWFCLTAAKIWSNRCISVTALCYSSVLFRKQRKIHPRGMRAGRPKRLREKRNPQTPSSILAPLFISFSPPPEPALCKLGRSAVLPEVLTLVLGPSFVLFSWAWGKPKKIASFSHLHPDSFFLF